MRKFYFYIKINECDGYDTQIEANDPIEALNKFLNLIYENK